MSKVEKNSVDNLMWHKPTIERSLADLARGQNTAHLSLSDIDQIVRGFNARLIVINERLATIAREDASPSLTHCGLSRSE